MKSINGILSKLRNSSPAHCCGDKVRGKICRKDAQKGNIGSEKVALVGTPNVGKSVIFGLLTGRYVTVSNYPGTTVEVCSGNVEIEGKKFLITDTPGVNSLTPMSEDECVTRDILLYDRPEVVLQVGDMKNPKRTLLITAQLAEMGLPVILDLNMQDEAMDKGINIDMNSLGQMIGTDVIATVAPERKGLKGLRETILKKAYNVPGLEVKYEQVIEEYVEKVSLLLPSANISKRSLALMILSGDKSLTQWLHANLEEKDVGQIEKLRDDCQHNFEKPVGLSINETRLRRVEEIVNKVMKRTPSRGGAVSGFIGSICMHPVWGLPILLLVLFGLYEFVGVFGAGTLVDFFENTLFAKYLNPILIVVIDAIVPGGFFRDLFIGEYGIITMALTYSIAIVLPITTTFFIFFSILEDSGYLPRLAITSNRFLQFLGLSGKAVLPMVLGLGCGTMAVMTTRILDSKRERLIATFLLALAIPCSAQLGVIMGIMGSISPVAMFIWIGTVLFVLILVGHITAKVLPGKKTDFFLEIPPIRMPALSNIYAKTLGRAVWYLKEAVPLFILGTFSLFMLDKLKVLGVIEQLASPVVVTFLGLPEKATEAFLIGFFRRDYGAAGLFYLFEHGSLTHAQALVSLVTITLFVPCLASFFVVVKERGMKTAIAVMATVFALAVLFGGLFNWALRISGIQV